MKPIQTTNSEKKFCPDCGKENLSFAKYCSGCGYEIPESKFSSQNNNQQSPSVYTVIINQVEIKTNGIGTAGFVLALITIFLSWTPVLGWIIWLIGFILSLIGAFKMPKGLAIAGLVISIIGILLIFVFGMILENEFGF